jgi:hypothetical protein
MSFDLYLLCFDNEQKAGIPSSLIKDAFGDFVQWQEPDHGLAHYGNTLDGTSIDLSPLNPGSDMICCISVNRPLADPRFQDALFRIMCLGNVGLVFPGHRGPLIAKDSVAAHIPKNLGKAILIRTGNDIGDQIENS